MPSQRPKRLVYRKGDRVLAPLLKEDGTPAHRKWLVGTVTSIGRGRFEGTLTVRFDAGALRRLRPSELYGRTPFQRKRKRPIEGRDVEAWNVETPQDDRSGASQRDPGLTARQMLSATPRNIAENARFVAITKRERKVVRGSDTKVLLTQTRTAPSATSDGRARYHVQRVDILHPEGTTNVRASGARLKVSCNCSHFQFVCEVALHRWGAADIRYSNGDWPYQQNPRGQVGVCKHLHEVLSR